MGTRSTATLPPVRTTGRRRFAPFLATVLAILAATAPPSGAVAEGPVTVVTIGESNSPEQLDELLGYFGAEDPGAVVTVSVGDTIAAMDGIYDLSGVDTAYSSTALTCGAADEGISVTTRNIEVVTPALYAMALLTAGIDDGTLVVAAPADAPALGMTALTGVFQTWDAAGCGGTDADRQRLALEQLALVVRIGWALEATGGVDAATRIVLEAQREIVEGGVTDPGKIEALIADQEAAEGAVIPSELRAELIDLLVRIGEADLEWDTFAAGWTTEAPGEGGIRLRGLAVGGMVETATIQATATPDRRPATPAATPRATTAPATATPSPTPSPTATPAAVAITGTVTGNGDGGVAVDDGRGGGPAAYRVDPGVAVFRSGAAAEIADIVPGDRVRLTYDPVSGRTTRIDAEPATAAATTDEQGGWTRRLLPLGVLALVAALLGPVVFLLGRRRRTPQRVSRSAVAMPVAQPAPVEQALGAGPVRVARGRGIVSAARSSVRGVAAPTTRARSTWETVWRSRPTLRGR